MTDYYVDSVNGNAANGGTSWSDALDTLNNAEDLPVSAGDTVHCRGVFRETLTCDVSGSSGNPITYRGHVSPDTGAMPRITGSDNDQSGTRNNCIALNSKNYRTFRGFSLDTNVAGQNLVTSTWDINNIIVEDCAFLSAKATGVQFLGNNLSTITVRRCLFWVSGIGVDFIVDTDDVGSVIENCWFLCSSRGFKSSDPTGIAIRNSLFSSGSQGVYTESLAGGVVTVNNCNFYGLGTAMASAAGGQITEDYNNMFACTTDRTNVAVGANSTAYSPVFQSPILIPGFEYSWWFGKLSPWSALGSIAGTGVAMDDLFGISRTGSPSSWGPIEYTSNPARRDWDAGTSRGRRGL